VRNVLIIQTIGAVAIFFLFKWPYGFGFVPLQCDFVLIEGKIIALTNAVLISFIVVLNIVVYVKTKHYVRPDRIVSVHFVNNNNQPINPDDDEEEPQQVTIHLAPTNTADGTNSCSNANQQGRSDEPSSKTSLSATRNNALNPSNHNTPLQIHGGNRRMEVSIVFMLDIIFPITSSLAPLLDRINDSISVLHHPDCFIILF